MFYHEGGTSLSEELQIVGEGEEVITKDMAPGWLMTLQ